MYPIAIIGVVALLPFAVNNFIQGRHALGAVVLAAVSILGIDALAIHFKKPPPIPYMLFLVPMAAGMTLSLRSQGVIGALWCYPTVLFCYFVLPRRVANASSLMLLVAATFLVYRYIGAQVTIRFAVTLGLTIAVVNVILNIIGRLQTQLLSQAITDPLTGAFNRRHLESCLTAAVARRQRVGAPASLLLVDADHFKHINDQRGHEAGDQVLTAVVALIRKRARVLDLVFRVGGDEFAVMLPDTNGPDAATLAEHLRATIAGTAILDGWPVTVSIGVSELQPDDSLDRWMRRADGALYQAKKAGRNRVTTQAP